MWQLCSALILLIVGICLVMDMLHYPTRKSNSRRLNRQGVGSANETYSGISRNRHEFQISDRWDSPCTGYRGYPCLRRECASRVAGSKRTSEHACARGRFNCDHSSGRSPGGYAYPDKPNIGSSNIGSNRRAAAHSDVRARRYACHPADGNCSADCIAANTTAHTGSRGYTYGYATTANSNRHNNARAQSDGYPSAADSNRCNNAHAQSDGYFSAADSNSDRYCRSHTHAGADRASFACCGNECWQSCARLHAAERARGRLSPERVSGAQQYRTRLLPRILVTVLPRSARRADRPLRRDRGKRLNHSRRERRRPNRSGNGGAQMGRAFPHLVQLGCQCHQGIRRA